jgi:hypothetical protein
MASYAGSESGWPLPPHIFLQVLPQVRIVVQPWRANRRSSGRLAPESHLEHGSCEPIPGDSMPIDPTSGHRPAGVGLMLRKGLRS